MTNLSESNCYEILMNSNFLHLRNRFLCNSGDYLLSTLLIELLDKYNNQNDSIPGYAKTLVYHTRILQHKTNCNLSDFLKTIDKLVERDLAKIEIGNINIKYNLNFKKIFELYIPLPF